MSSPGEPPSTSSAPDNHSNESPVTISPAPWTTKAESYWMFLTLGKVPQEGGAVYDEAGTKGTGEGEFVGGLGCVMVVRYLDTPVGKLERIIS